MLLCSLRARRVLKSFRTCNELQGNSILLYHQGPKPSDAGSGATENLQATEGFRASLDHRTTANLARSKRHPRVYTLTHALSCEPHDQAGAGSTLILQLGKMKHREAK